MQVNNLEINYRPEPTALEFHADSSFVRGIMGPYGSGKSSMCCLELFNVAREQHPDRWNRRRTRWAVIRNTYPELKSTTIRTWGQWFPANVCPIVYSAPIVGSMYVPLPDGTTVEMELLFLALDKPADLGKLLSLEVTGIWINEARELPKAIVDNCTGRVGRYPPVTDFYTPDEIEAFDQQGVLDEMKRKVITWSGLIMDTNPPDDEHWWYQAAETGSITGADGEPVPTDGWRFWKQPPALLERPGGRYEPNPAAENVKYQPLGYQYWQRMIGGKSREWINVYVMGNYGTVMDGKGVYGADYNDDMHASEAVNPIRGLPLYVGWDFGLTPAIAICQIDGQGRLLILDEVTSDNIGVVRFAENEVKPFLVSRGYDKFDMIHVGDPAGVERMPTDEATVFKELRAVGFDVIPGYSNSLTPRLESVRYFLTNLIAGKPALQLSKRCTVLRKGFNGGYKYRRLQVPGEERFSLKPEKDRFSHPHDALQYVAMHVREAIGSTASNQVPRVQPRVISTSTGY